MWKNLFLVNLLTHKLFSSTHNDLFSVCFVSFSAFVVKVCSISCFRYLISVAKLSYKRLYKLTIQASLTLSYLVYLVTKSALYESDLLQLLFSFIKGALPGLRQFLTIESPLKKMKKLLTWP